MNILLVSPNAPPKNSAESMQVGRYLVELNRKHQVILVTTPEERGWVVNDPSLDIGLDDVEKLVLRLPFHRLASRLVASGYVRQWVRPDAFFWMAGRASWVVRRLRERPDVIYSRSLPFSSALLARALKKRLRVPWIMHLSDPWLDNPYLAFGNVMENEQEYSCFLEADGISVTTECLMNFYREKYPEFGEKLFLSPNVMPMENQRRAVREVEDAGSSLKLLYTGALYGNRDPRLLLDVLDEMQHEDPRFRQFVELQFVGNVSESIARMIDDARLPGVSLLGRRDYADVLGLQAGADVMLSFEPDGENPLLKCFLPSKILDYIHAGKPFVAITPRGSETWKLCEQGYGWAISPDDNAGLKDFLLQLVDQKLTSGQVTLGAMKEAPKQYSVQPCVEILVRKMMFLCDESSRT